MSLEKIKARMQAATPGPWTVEKRVTLIGTAHNNVFTTVYLDRIAKSHNRTPYIESHNAEFIAHSRQDIDRLVRAYELLREFSTQRCDCFDKEPFKCKSCNFRNEADAILEEK